MNQTYWWYNLIVVCFRKTLGEQDIDQRRELIRREVDTEARPAVWAGGACGRGQGRAHSVRNTCPKVNIVLATHYAGIKLEIKSSVPPLMVIPLKSFVALEIWPFLRCSHMLSNPIFLIYIVKSMESNR